MGEEQTKKIGIEGARVEETREEGRERGGEVQRKWLELTDETYHSFASSQCQLWLNHLVQAQLGLMLPQPSVLELHEKKLLMQSFAQVAAVKLQERVPVGQFQCEPVVSQRKYWKIHHLVNIQLFICVTEQWILSAVHSKMGVAATMNGGQLTPEEVIGAPLWLFTTLMLTLGVSSCCSMTCSPVETTSTVSTIACTPSAAELVKSIPGAG